MNIANTHSSLYQCAAISKNIGFRSTMEDRAVVMDETLFVPNIQNQVDLAYFAVFDGHGGTYVADYLQNYFHVEVANKLAITDDVENNIVQILKNSFLELNATIINNQKQKELTAAKIIDTSGSTATVAILADTKRNLRLLYVANVGDSAAILVRRNGTFNKMTYDHKVSDDIEVLRIIDRGGVVFQRRVGGVLAITRAFGDYYLESNGITAEAYIDIEAIAGDSEERNYSHIVLASDGLWDVCKEKDVAEFIINHYTLLTCKQLGDELVNMALRLGSRDNITVIVVHL